MSMLCISSGYRREERSKAEGGEGEEAGMREIDQVSMCDSRKPPLAKLQHDIGEWESLDLVR